MNKVNQGNNSGIIKKESVDEQKWWRLLHSEDYSVLEDYRAQRIKTIEAENKELVKNQDMNTLIKVGNNLARIDELERFLKRAKFMHSKLANTTEKEV